MLTYIDTSMLLKRYVPELGAEELDLRLTQEQPDLILSELGRVELLSALARAVRAGRIDATFSANSYSRFLEDVSSGVVELQPIHSGVIQQAADVIRQLKQPLATLDSLHLATALRCQADMFFTTDQQLSRAAKEVGLAVWPAF